VCSAQFFEKINFSRKLVLSWHERIRLQEQKLLGIFPGLRGPKNQFLDRDNQLFLRSLSKVAAESRFTGKRAAMIITEMTRTIGGKVFLPFVALCLVGVFSSVSFAEEATTNKPAPETPAAETPHNAPSGKIAPTGQATGNGIDRGVDATKRGVRRAGEATSNGIERGVDATRRGLERAGEATGNALEKAGEAIEKTFPGKDEER
jgi:hypothetical protein